MIPADQGVLHCSGAACVNRQPQTLPRSQVAIMGSVAPSICPSNSRQHGLGQLQSACNRAVSCSAAHHPQAAPISTSKADAAAQLSEYLQAPYSNVRIRHANAPQQQQQQQQQGLLALKEWAVTCAALGAGEQTVVLRKGGIREPAFKPAASSFLLFPTGFHAGSSLVKQHAAERFAKELQIDPKEQSVLEVSVAAEVTGAWTTADPDVVTALDNFYVWTPEYFDKRLRWRSRQPITVLELRCWRLAQPLRFANDPDLWGCFSWVTLPAAAASYAGAAAAVPHYESPKAATTTSSDGADSGCTPAGAVPTAAGNLEQLLAGAVPAVADEEFAQRQQQLRGRLVGLQGVQRLEL